jgi:hypothetical protein
MADLIIKIHMDNENFAEIETPRTPKGGSNTISNRPPRHGAEPARILRALATRIESGRLNDKDGFELNDLEGNRIGGALVVD